MGGNVEELEGVPGRIEEGHAQGRGSVEGTRIDHASTLAPLVAANVGMSVEHVVGTLTKCEFKKMLNMPVREGESPTVDLEPAQGMVHRDPHQFGVAGERVVVVVAVAKDHMGLDADELIEHRLAADVAQMNEHGGPALPQQLHPGPRRLHPTMRV